MFAVSNNKARTFFLTKGKEYMANGFVYGGIDPTFKVSLLSFADQTIGYNYASDTYVGFFSFIPERYAYINTDMFSFKDGILWQHNSNPLNSNFYGEQYQPSVDIVFNEQPNYQKIFNSLEQESNVIWACPELSNQNGQLSRLVEADFQEIENAFYADVLGDYSGAADQTQALYYNGQLMGSNVLRATIQNNGTDLARLRFITLYSQINERTTK